MSLPFDSTQTLRLRDQSSQGVVAEQAANEIEVEALQRMDMLVLFG